jgi:transposase InsO family protein
MPYRPTQFNQVVGIDLKWIKDVAGNTLYMLNILDLATSFNLGICLRDKFARTISEAFKQYWLSWAGAPTKIVADQGREGFSDFTRCTRHLGAAFKMTASEAPWQNGMVERCRGVLGDIIEAKQLLLRPHK